MRVKARTPKTTQTTATEIHASGVIDGAREQGSGSAQPQGRTSGTCPAPPRGLRGRALGYVVQLALADFASEARRHALNHVDMQVLAAALRTESA